MINKKHVGFNKEGINYALPKCNKEGWSGFFTDGGTVHNTDEPCEHCTCGKRG